MAELDVMELFSHLALFFELSPLGGRVYVGQRGCIYKPARRF